MEWESLISDTNDIDQNWNKFNEIIKKLETMYIPTRKYRQIGKGNTFLMDEKTREKIREKNRFHSILSKLSLNSWNLPLFSYSNIRVFNNSLG
jgi:hypothetical protein